MSCFGWTWSVALWHRQGTNIYRVTDSLKRKHAGHESLGVHAGGITVVPSTEQTDRMCVNTAGTNKTRQKKVWVIWEHAIPTRPESFCVSMPQRHKHKGRRRSGRVTLEIQEDGENWSQTCFDENTCGSRKTHLKTRNIKTLLTLYFQGFEKNVSSFLERFYYLEKEDYK